MYVYKYIHAHTHNTHTHREREREKEKEKKKKKKRKRIVRRMGKRKRYSLCGTLRSTPKSTMLGSASTPVVILACGV